jgi:sulfatase maturation enzyme AslB (radical SAM superfamily)
MTDQLHRFQSLKILAHYDRLEAITRGEYPYPIDWHIYPSNHCQHFCEFCLFIQNGEQKNFHVKLPRGVLLRAVEDAARTDARLIHFSGGGEPLLNRHTLDALKLAQELSAARVSSGGKPLKVAMSTNGALLTPDVAEQVNYLRISLNAGTPEQHWRTNHNSDPRHPGDWHRIIENIERSIPHKREDIGLAFVVEHNNYQDIPAFCEVAASLGVDFVHIRPGFYYQAEQDAAVRSVMEAARLLCEQAKADNTTLKIFSISEKFEGYWTPRTYHACRAVLTGICLRATGDFAVCQDRTDLTFGEGYKLGQPFESIWHSEEHKALVDTIHDGEGGELGKCPRCVWNFRNSLLKSIETDELRIALV